VHLAPNPDKPQFEILVEGANQARADELVAIYTQQLEKFIEVIV